MCQTGGGQAGSQVFYLACFGMCINRGLSAFIPPVSLSPPANGVSRGGVELRGGDGIIQQSGMREGDASTIFFATRTDDGTRAKSPRLWRPIRTPTERGARGKLK